MKYDLVLDESKADEQRLIDFIGEDNAKLFFKLKPRMKQPFNDLYYWIKLDDKEALIDYLNQLNNTKSKSQQVKDAKQGAKLIYNKNGWKIYRIDTYEVAVHYGKNTKWCITGNYPGSEGQGQEYFYEYKDRGVINYYFIINPDNAKWCYLEVEDGFTDSVLWNAADDGIDTISDDTIPNFPEEAIDVLPGFRKRLLSRGALARIREELHKSKTLRYDKDTEEALSVYGHTNIPEWLVNATEHIIVKGGSYLGIKEIKDKTFAWFENVKDVVIEEGVTDIGVGAFANCESLIKVSIPSTVRNIWNRAFIGCDSLTKIYIPATVEFIGKKAFMYCNDDIIIYCGLTEEKADRFYTSGWNYLKMAADRKKMIVADCLYNVKKSNLVEESLTEEYKTKDWIIRQFSKAFLRYMQNISSAKEMLKAKIEDIAEGEWEDIVDYANSLEFPLVIYRGLRLSSLDKLDTSDLGVNWTTDEELFFADNSAFKNIDYVIEAEVNEDQIDWPETIHNYVYYSLRPQYGMWPESEVTLKPKAKLNNYMILKKEDEMLVPIQEA